MDLFINDCNGLTRINDNDFSLNFYESHTSIVDSIKNNKIIAYRIGYISPFINKGKMALYNQERKKITFYDVLFLGGRVFSITNIINSEDVIDNLPEELADWLIFNIDLI